MRTSKCFNVKCTSSSFTPINCGVQDFLFNILHAPLNAAMAIDLFDSNTSCAVASRAICGTSFFLIVSSTTFRRIVFHCSAFSETFSEQYAFERFCTSLSTSCSGKNASNSSNPFRTPSAIIENSMSVK